MEEAPENGKESSLSLHTNGMNCFMGAKIGQALYLGGGRGGVSGFESNPIEILVLESKCI
jgi:hypothetical protein